MSSNDCSSIDSDTSENSGNNFYDYNLKTEYTPLEQYVMKFSLQDTLSGKVDERDIIYSKREMDVMINFIDFVVTEAHDILPLLFEEDKQETIAIATFDLQYYIHKGVWFLMDFLRDEFKAAQSELELFQESATASYVARCFFLKVGKTFIKRYFTKFFTNFFNEKLDLEIDDYKITDEKVIEKNLQNLTKKTNELLQVIYSTMDQLPNGVKLVAKMHSELIKEYFPQLSQYSRFVSTGLFIMNQFYIQAFMYPEKYGICTAETLTLKNKRNLALIAKILQTLASGNGFKGKGSEYMKRVDALLKSNTRPLHDKFVSLIINSSSLPYTFLLDDSLTISNEAVSVLHMELCHKSAEIIRMFPTDISEKFCRFMVAIGEHKDKLDFLFDFTSDQQKMIKTFLEERNLEGVYIAKIDVSEHEGVDKKKKKKEQTINGFVIVSLHNVWILTGTGEVEATFHCLALTKVQMNEDNITFECARGDKTEKLTGSTARCHEIITSMIRAFKSSFPDEKIMFEIEAPQSHMNIFTNVYSLRTFTKCGGFTGVYEAQCSFREYPYNQSVRWAIENAKEEDKESKHMKVSRFYNGDLTAKEDNLTAIDLIPIFFALKSNMWFTDVSVEDMSLLKCFDGLVEYVKVNKVLKSLRLRNVDVGKGWDVLFEAYNENPKHPLRKLDVSDNIIDEKAIVLISTLVSKYHLQSLFLSNVLTNEKLSGALIGKLKLLEDKKNLKTIDLSGAKLPAAGIEFIASQFPLNFPDLEKIYLRDITVPKTSSMLRFLQNMPLLKVLDLSGMKMSLKVIDKTSQDLQEYIHCCKKLEILEFNRVVMPGDVLKNIIKDIDCSQVSINLRQADFQVESVKVFSTVFIGLESVKLLDISDSGIGEEGLVYLLESLCQNTILESINLSKNLFSVGNKERVVKALVKLISGGTGLKTLKIAG
ncbi:carmil, putative, partial [Entamoeba invadens IP1]